MRVSCRRFLVGVSALFVAATAAPEAQVPPAPGLIDLRSAVIVTSARATAREKKAVQVLVEEVQKRTLITLPVATSPTAGRPSINIGRIGGLPGGASASLGGLARPGAEGFQLAAAGTGAGAEITVAGADERGVLFGVGRLLRELRMDRGTLAVAPSLRALDDADDAAPRPSARLPAEDQLLRRLDRRDVGAVHPRPGRLRQQRHRAHPAAFRRRRRQPALSRCRRSR